MTDAHLTTVTIGGNESQAYVRVWDEVGNEVEPPATGWDFDALEAGKYSYQISDPRYGYYGSIKSDGADIPIKPWEVDGDASPNFVYPGQSEDGTANVIFHTANPDGNRKQRRAWASIQRRKARAARTWERSVYRRLGDALVKLRRSGEVPDLAKSLREIDDAA